MTKRIFRHRNPQSALSPFGRGVRDVWGDFWNFPTAFETHLLKEIQEQDFFAAPMDITETDDEFKVVADLPGVNPEDISVETEDGALVVNAKRETEKEKKGKNFLRSERSSGSFYQKLDFPSSANLEKASCTSKDGVLTITIPKQASNKSKKIDVKLLK